MRVGFGQFNRPDPEYLRFAARHGATDVLLNRAQLPIVDGTWQRHDLVKLRLQVESYGLKLGALENVPASFMDHIILGGPRRDEQIDKMMTTVRNMARAGIPVFGYGWNPSQVWRTTPVQIRGGAFATAYDQDELDGKGIPPVHGRTFSEDEMWANLEYWIKAITPVAEGEGIRLGIHPPDPPVESHGGVPPVLRSFDGYRRLIEIVDSPSNAIEFCQGTFSEMTDAANGGIYDMIRYFGERNRILYVHFRNLSSPTPESFHEEFVNTGHVDMYRAMEIYHEVGFDGFFIDDHVPSTFEDTQWGHRGRAFANGYVQGLIEAVRKRGAGQAPEAGHMIPIGHRTGLVDASLRRIPDGDHRLVSGTDSNVLTTKLER